MLSVSASCCLAPIGAQLAYQVDSCEVSSNPFAELLAGEQQHSVGRVDQHQWRARLKTRALAHRGRYHHPTTISHHQGICPTHDATIPL